MSLMKRFMMTLALTGALIFSTQANQAQANDFDRTAGTIIGAVGGGILGSTLGKGKGRIVATAAGTIFGAVLGREIVSNDSDYDRDDYRPRQRERVVYREAPPRKKVVVYKERKPKKHKKWKRVVSYDGDVLVCNKNGKRCHWYD
jgi:uncharacterized protein YcfJ